ncbi:cytochrome c1 [Roseibium hamelinense]|uniref:Cytochrome c1 n=1 Tax=Roseibium hamelinense TaxID=150831 RepID=A0A562SXV9_9HYPH|nr:cytochrome c1 [Roseibium hamelinense]MTI43605.1 cytochrome c1 [Roseibium hamelinense]TWI86121.1 cytochrome c1 [Roseibium hamelinense]
MSTMIKMVRAFTAAAALAVAAPALAAGDHKPHVDRYQWSFSGPFGTFDRAQLQRGFKVYRENCSACHGLRLVAFRNLAENGGPSFSEDEAKQIASEYTVVDGPDDFGDMFDRPAILADRFPSPFPNEQAARAANNGAYPPDFSLLAKARAAHRGFPWFVFDAFTQYAEQGPDYITSLLTGYVEPPEGMEVPVGQYYNDAFLAGQFISMAPPLYPDSIEYTDGTPMTVEQYSKDVAAFMMWAAEPHLEDRKKMGFRVMIFLIVFAGMLYFTMKSLWRNVKH